MCSNPWYKYLEMNAVVEVNIMQAIAYIYYWENIIFKSMWKNSFQAVSLMNWK